MGSFRGAPSGVEAKKRRKLNHAEQKDMLEREICLLESGVAVLKTRNLPAHLVVEEDPILRPIAVELTALLYAKQKQQLHVAQMQSALSTCIIDQPYYPLYSRICLTKSWSERRATLLAMRRQKLRGARQPAEANLGTEEEELIVTMRRATFLKIRRPEFPVSELALEELHDEMMQWADVMLKSIRNIVYA
ncbi:hypothetical protein KRP22_007302 [Phytophthora ramorum]|nr:hypothetical protein KRP22_4687 [Phytophthora ramorum]